MSEVQLEDERGARRWIGPALLVSLVINLFLVGLIAASFFIHRHPPRPGIGPVPSPFFRMLHGETATLPKADRALVRDIMVAEFPAIRPYFSKIEEARKELADILSADSYDKDKMQAAFDKLDAAQSDMIGATREAMVNGFAQMKPEQRKRLADSMRAIAERRLADDHGAHPGEAPPPPPPGSDGPPPPPAH